MSGIAIFGFNVVFGGIGLVVILFIILVLIKLIGIFFTKSRKPLKNTLSLIIGLVYITTTFLIKVILGLLLVTSFFGILSGALLSNLHPVLVIAYVLTILLGVWYIYRSSKK